MKSTELGVQRLAIDPAAAGLSADVAATVEAIGTRSANPFVRLTSFFTSSDRPLVDGVDEPALKAELLARTRAALSAAPDGDAWRRRLGELADDLGPFYRRSAWAGCC